MLSLVGFSSTKLQFLSTESQTSPTAMPDMEGIGLLFGLFVFHWNMALSDSGEEFEWELLVHGVLSTHYRTDIAEQLPGLARTDHFFLLRQKYFYIFTCTVSFNFQDFLFIYFWIFIQRKMK